MANDQPAVFNAGGPGVTPTNTVNDTAVDQALEGRSVQEQQATGGQASDTTQTAINQNNRLDADTPLRVGRVLLSLPYIHCYKVQVSGRAAATVATALTHNSMLPLGVRAGEVIPANSQVVLWEPKGGKLAYIIGVIPVAMMSDQMNMADHVQQGGNSGPKKVEAVRNIPKSVSDAMGWVPQCSGRPMDGTSGEFVRQSETGIGILIDSFQAYLRVNEVCGLWLNYFDNYAKLAALSLNLMSYCENNLQTYDEGENFAIRGHCTFPWEATGMYGSAEKFSVNHPKRKVQLDRDFPFAEEDVDDFAQTPVYRLTDYTGYLGQGWNRTLMKPAGTSGKRLMTDTDDDTGLFNEFLALDGAYSVRSAKSITLAKYPLIPNPRRIRTPEDAKGDDLTENNDYRFSGKFGGGDEHKVREWKADSVTELPNLMKPAGILDMLAHHYNWKSTHPFYYHKKDYRYPQEEDGQELSSVKFHSGSFYEAYVAVEPTAQINISDSYGSVNYYNTASFFSMTDDGSVIIGDGYGSQVTMTGGQIRLEAGGDVMLMSGSRVVTLARESIIRTKDSIDISSSDKDVRIKAERNLQVSSGSLLLEALNPGSTQQYDGKIGEEVQASGITLLSKGGSVNVLTRDYYLRSGIADAPTYGTGSGTTGRVISGIADATGDVVIDVAKGRGRYVNYAAQQSFYTRDFVGIWHSPTGDDDPQDQIKATHYFSKSLTFLEGVTLNEGTFVACGDDGFIGAEQSFIGGKDLIVLAGMACLKGINSIGDSSTNNIPAQVNKFFKDACEGVKDMIIDLGKDGLEAVFTDRWWKENEPGNTELLEDQIGFSFRDLSEIEDKAYGYSKDKFFLLEARYQQLERAGLSSRAAQAWTENAISYQGKQLYPWPGKINWEDNDTLLRYKNGADTFKLFDQGGFALSRDTAQSDYEEPEFADWDMITPATDYKL